MELASQKDLQDSFVDRLELNEKRIDSMISGLDKVINLDDPVGQTEHPTLRHLVSKYQKCAFLLV